MKLYVVFAQREERYPGQYAPEAIAVADEYTNEDNPEYIKNELKKAGDSFIAADIFEVEIGGAEDAIRTRLLDPMNLKGTLKEE